MSASEPKQRATIADTLAQLPGPHGERFFEVFRKDDISVDLYAPRGADEQTPHQRDEIYFVAQGEGNFVYEDRRQKFHPGDFLFVPAGAEHRFEDFTDDFAVWVVFFGPDLIDHDLPEV